MQPLGCQPLGMLGDVGFMGNRWVWEISRPIRISRVFVDRPMHPIDLLGARIVRLQVIVADRPGRSYALSVLAALTDLAAESRQTGAEHLGVAPDPVVNPGAKRATAIIHPMLTGLVAPLEEHCFVTPVLGLLWQECAALHDQNAGAAILEGVGQSAAAA